MKMLMQLRDFSYLVRLGCLDAERAFPQEIRVSIDLEYEEAPLVCSNDNIEDGFCYSQVNDRLTKVLETQEFKTVEHLALRTLNLVLDDCPKGMSVVVRIHKVKPPIARFTQGVVIELRGRS